MKVTDVDLWAEGLTFRVRAPAPRPTLVDAVDLAVGAGTVTGLLGPNGSGKSTLLRLLVGALPASDGRAWIGAPDLDRADLLRMPPRDRARLLALVEQDGAGGADLTVAEVVLLGRLPHRGAFGGVDADDEAAAMAALDRVGGLDLADREFATLSGGERQRVHVARALAQAPRVLLLDEPTNHLDLSAQLRLLRLVREVAADGAGVLMSLHDLTLAARSCDQVVVLDAGAVVAAGHPREVLTPDLIRAVWRVEADWVLAPRGDTLAFGDPLD